MPLSATPRLLPAVEISQGTRPQEELKDVVSSGLPFHSTSPLPSTSPCKEDMSMVTANQAIASSDSNLTHHSPMLPGSEVMQWPSQAYFTPRNLPQDDSAFGTPTYFTASSPYAGHPQHIRNGLPYTANRSLGYPVDYTTTHSRDFDGTDLVSFPRDMASSYPPSAFFHSPPDRCTAHSLPDTSAPELMQFNNHYDVQYGEYSQQEDQLDYTSPYSGMSRASTPYSTGYEHSEPIDKEQPYAQLIYRALLDAPQHTMILRDIYDWFRVHTDKAAQSETKGWQNSIRHNLSMNGAFEKVDSPVESSTKGFMWRLTEDALREGVKSTTRYRSKAPNKRSSHRAQPPLPQRQASGAKGGHAARRAASQRRSQRMRDLSYHIPNHHGPRSEPYPVSGFANGWDETEFYPDSPAYQPRVDSPYSQTSFTPYHAPKDDVPFTPMIGLASHLMSPPRSYANTPNTPETPAFIGGETSYLLDHVPNEPLFTGSPTPPIDEPITPVNAGMRGEWTQDVSMGVYEDLSHFGGGM